MRQSNWTQLEEAWTRVRDWAREKGATSFATVGQAAHCNYHTVFATNKPDPRDLLGLLHGPEALLST